MSRTIIATAPFGEIALERTNPWTSVSHVIRFRRCSQRGNGDLRYRFRLLD